MSQVFGIVKYKENMICKQSFFSGVASLIGKPEFTKKKLQKVHEKCIFQPLHNETMIHFEYEGIIFKKS